MTHDTAQHIHDPDPPRTHLVSNPTKWLSEHDTMLKEMVEEKKHSYAFIAKEINAAHGTSYSRNSVIGRANRLALNNTRPDQNSRPLGRNRPKLRIIKANGNSDRLKVTQSVQTDLPTLRVIPLQPLNYTLADLPESGCRYIAGDDFLYCGHPRRKDSSFCTGHHQIVWLPPTERNARSRGFR